MILYRSVLGAGSSGVDYSSTYTATVGGVKQSGSCAMRFGQNDTSALNKTITIGNNVNTCYMMFMNTYYPNEIYFKGTTNRALNLTSMFYYCNYGYRINIHFNSALHSLFYNNGNGLGMVGTTCTWTNMTNGFYNATRNLYCYNNYSG